MTPRKERPIPEEIQENIKKIELTINDRSDSNKDFVEHFLVEIKPTEEAVKKHDKAPELRAYRTLNNLMDGLKYNQYLTVFWFAEFVNVDLGVTFETFCDGKTGRESLIWNSEVRNVIKKSIQDQIKQAREL